MILDKNILCKAFSSDLTPQERDKTLDEFRNEEFKVLITTDILARGIDIPNTFLVINYQTPIILLGTNQEKNPSICKIGAIPDCITYYHRAGRAGHFGRCGLCFTIVTDDKDEENLKTLCCSLEPRYSTQIH